MAHAERDAVVSLGLYPVDDPLSYGLVRRAEDGTVTGFLEKPTPDEVDTDEINAGMYVLERSVADLIPPGRAVSIEREVFPRLVGQGLYGLRLGGYWMDIGTPERYLEATWDILEGRVRTDVETDGSGVFVSPAASVDDGAQWGRGALVGPGSSIAAGAKVSGSALIAGTRVGAGAEIRARSSARMSMWARARASWRARCSATRCELRPGRGRRREGGCEEVGERERGRSRRGHPRSRQGQPARRRPGSARPPDRRHVARGVGADRAIRGSGLVVCGMGGSAIGADLARAAIGDGLTRPLLTVRGYEPPTGIPADHAFLCSSYSGGTEETLACYAAAEALGARRIVASTGGALAEMARADGVPVIGIPSGFQPRAAVGYTFTVAPRSPLAPWPPAGCTWRSTPPPLTSPMRASRCWRGPPRSPATPRHGARDLWRGPDRAGGHPLEGSGERKRQGARLRDRASGGGSQRDRRLGEPGSRTAEPSS